MRPLGVGSLLFIPAPLLAALCSWGGILRRYQRVAFIMQERTLLGFGAHSPRVVLSCCKTEYSYAVTAAVAVFAMPWPEIARVSATREVHGMHVP
jgi:hypothetical protein